MQNLTNTIYKCTNIIKTTGERLLTINL